MGKMKWRILKESEYRKKVEKVVIKHEGNYPVVYLDSKGIPTTGPGKALVVNGVDKKTGERKWVVAEGRAVEGVNILESTTGKPLTTVQRQSLQTAADNMNKYGLDNDRNGVKNSAYKANAPLFYKDPTDDSLKGRTDPDNNTFGVKMTEGQTVEFKDKVVDASEQEFDRFTTRSGNTRLDEKIPPSEERAALISIFHHRPADINSEIRQAINEGDREGVIIAIEGSKTAGTYKARRKDEADQFGRPDDPDVKRTEGGENLPSEQIPEAEVLQVQQGQQVPDSGSSVSDSTGITLGDIFDILTGRGDRQRVENPHLPMLDPSQVKEAGNSLEDILRPRKDDEDEKLYVKYNNDMHKFVQGKALYGPEDIKVNSYNRSTGEVKSHTRTKPDGDPSNNISWRKK